MLLAVFVLSGCSEKRIDQPVLPYDPEVGEWNPGMNEIRYVTKKGYDSRLGFITDAMIAEKFYADGQWIVRFDKTVTRVEIRYDEGNDWIKEIYLPDSITDLYIDGTVMDLREFYVPEEIETMYVRLGDNIERFYGNHVSEDGRCVIKDGNLLAFASGGLDKYTVPAGVESIGYQSFGYSGIKKVTIPEGVKSLDSGAFTKSQVEEVELPASLEQLGDAFHMCVKIKKFSGPCEFISEDGLYLYAPYSGGKIMLHFAAASGTVEYAVPEDINYLDTYAFYGCRTLKELTFTSKLGYCPSGRHFEGCDNLQFIHGPQVSYDNRSMIHNRLLYLAVCKGLKKYEVPLETGIIEGNIFVNAGDLEAVTMSDNVEKINGSAFNGCPKLKEITASARIESFGTFSFNEFENLERIYCRAVSPPSIYAYGLENAKLEKLKIYIPKGSLESYMQNRSWEPLQKYLEEYEYTDLPQSGGSQPEPEPDPEPDPDGYVSRDYSRDGSVARLQKATKGGGINLILMGDAYSDRLVADGTYSDDINRACEAFFSVEPFKTYRNHFNVYQVTAVSRHEVYSPTSVTALETWFGDGTRVGGNDETVFSYACNVVPESRLDDALIIVVMNKGRYAGTTYMYPPQKGDYGSGKSVAYFGNVSDDATFAGIVRHEACGHGFAKLGDEYFSKGDIPEEDVKMIKARAEYGWYRNIDFTSELSRIKWKLFAADERYAEENIGAFEGGLTYKTGVWRPTETSIMSNNTNGFNAPSREAVWYRIHKLSYGEDWEYDREEFVKYDEVNRKAATKASEISGMPPAPLAPPVIM